MHFWYALSLYYDFKLFIYFVHCGLVVEVIMLGFGLYVAVCVANLYASIADKNKDQK